MTNDVEIQGSLGSSPPNHGHLADLRASGLSDETIALAGIFSANHTAPILGWEAGGGLVFPYPGCGDFARVKLDHPGDGGKYRSPKDSGNHLFIPTTLDPGVLDDTNVPLWVAEGEKKCLKANQEGLASIGLSGVWSWKRRDPKDENKSIVIPDFDKVAWAGRIVYLCFDADAATNQNVLDAEHALAEELRRRRAYIVVVRLPGPEKGLDDFLVAHPVGSLLALTRQLPSTEDRVTGQITTPGIVVGDFVHANLTAIAAELELAPSAKKAMTKMAGSRIEPWVQEANPSIIASGRQDKEVDFAWDSLKRANGRRELVFSRGSVMVEVGRGESGTPTLFEVSAARLSEILSRVGFWRKLTKDGVKDIYPVERAINAMLADRRPSVPQITLLTAVPIFTSAGKLISKPGYDHESGIFYMPPKGLAIPPVNKVPTPEDVATARSLILENLLVDFPFTNNGSRAAAVALLIGSFVRAMILGPTPLNVVEKHQPGMGGSLLAKSITTVALGHEAPGMTEADSEEETRKRITSFLITSPAFALIENVNAVVKGGALAQVITCREWTDRILGSTRMATVPVSCLWIAVGNNPQFSGELADRVVPITIDRPGVVRPRDIPQSEFKHKLPEWAEEHRGELIWACLTLAQHWIAAGQPRADLTFGSFQAWAGVMGGILEASGITGLLSNRAEFLAHADEEVDAFTSFVRSWWEEYGETAAYTSDLITLAGVFDQFGIDAGRRNPDGSPTKAQQTKMGAILRRYDKRPAVLHDGRKVKITRLAQDTKGSRWCLRLIETAPKAPAAPNGTYGTSSPDTPRAAASSLNEGREEALDHQDQSSEREHAVPEVPQPAGGAVSTTPVFEEIDPDGMFERWTKGKKKFGAEEVSV
jgi:hypothetical protein